SPGETAPTWTELEWRIAEAVSAMHGVSSLLGSVLRWQGPARWQRFLDEQRNHTLSRHQRVAALLRDIDTQARREGVAVTALKGAALHALGVYRAGERPMADVDLLVRGPDLERAARVLEQVGYAYSCTWWKHEAFVPRDAPAVAGFGEHAANPIKIDLHVRIFERLPVVEADITETVLGSRAEPGLNGYPTRAAMMAHLLLHAAGNMRARSLRMIQLHDIAGLAAHMSADDWNAVAPDPAQWWALPPLEFAARHYPRVIPPDVLATFARACPRHLRRACRQQALTDVSLSNPWIEAFPGIEWSPTPMDRVRYVVSRVWPDREMLTGRENLAQSHPWMEEHAWTRMPQWRRVLRWVRSRPARVETMHPVAAVLRGLR
ncbi:MAG TPA: nucleotidyltransferase family protein, partial [Steroidobacteraceae bacterium]|nr:nucleotidyltransferase family protein [Steroidobacteraceae bacterium]